MNVPKELASLGIPKECTERRSAAQELGRRFSIRPDAGDEVWRIHLDGCWLAGTDQKRVDYLFWCRSASGHRSVSLVELKGKDFGRALEQIDSTLQRLCRRPGSSGVHKSARSGTLAHEPVSKGGVRAFVVLSKGSGMSRRRKELRVLQEKYGVIVYPHSRQIQIDGLDSLFK